MYFFLNRSDKLTGVFSCLIRVDAVSMVEAMSEGDDNSEEDEALYLFRGSCEKKIGVDEYNGILFLDKFCEYSYPEDVRLLFYLFAESFVSFPVLAADDGFGETDSVVDCSCVDHVIFLNLIWVLLVIWVF